MKPLIDMLSKTHGFHTFQPTESSVGVTTPQTFACGKPASYYISQTPQGRLILDDYGLNFHAFSQSLPNSDNAEKMLARLIKETSQLVTFEKHRIMCESSLIDIDIVIGEYLNVLGRLVSYQPKTIEKQNIDEVVALIYDFLISKYGDIVTHKPRITGISGAEHIFAFQAGNMLIDYAKPQTDKTGKLLRKIIDALNSNDNLKFQIVIDDQDQQAFKRESSILSTVASITPYSRIASLH